MTENILLSMNQLPTEGDTPSRPNLSKPSIGGLNLSDIPVFTPGTKERPPSENFATPSAESSYSEEETVEEGKFEYEFTNLWEGCLYSVYLYDTNDLSACERVLNRPVKAEELSYSDTGNGFVVDDGFKYTFKKNPYKRNVLVPVGIDKQIRRRTSIKVESAEDILSTL